MQLLGMEEGLKMAAKQEAEYRALTHIDYKNKDTGQSSSVEKGEKIVGLNEIAVKNELLAGNIEEWEEGDK